MLIGEVIKKLRLEKGWTIRELSAKTGLSVGFLSNVERDINSPTISSLAKICNALETNLVSLFENGASDEKIVTKKSERKILVKSKQSKTIYEYLSPPHKNLKATCIKMEPGGDYGEGLNGHKGDEFGIVLEGVMEVSVGNEVYILEEGDSIYIKAYIPHKYRNIGNTPCSSIWVVNGSEE